MQKPEETILTVPELFKLKPISESRYWKKVDRNGPVPEQFPELGRCWIWIPAFNHPRKYGAYRVCSRVIAAHRASWEIHFGRIEDGKDVCHKCDRPWCVNPAHLFLGTHQDNMVDMVRKGRQTFHYGDDHWTHKYPERVCRGEKASIARRGKAMGDKNGARLYPERLKRGSDIHFSKLSAGQVSEIRRRRAEHKTSYKKLGLEYGVSDTAIIYIVKRRNWAHIP